MNYRKPIFIACALPLGVMLVNAQEWPQWRGPNRDGITTAAAPPVWADRAVAQWKVRVGAGHASPVVSAGRAYVHAREDEREVVSAIDVQSGKVIWKASYDAPYQVNPAAARYGKGPRSTPIVQDGLVYTFGIGGILSCLDAASGAVKWRTAFADRFPQSVPDFGVAMSPLVDRGLLIVHAGGDGKGALIALDARTGSVKWIWDGDGPAYASPIAADFGGVRHIVTQTQRFIVGVDASSGKLQWRVPFTTDYDQNIVTPARAADLLIVSGLSKGTFALRISRSASGWAADRAWENPDVSMYMTSPVVVGDAIYGLSHRDKGRYFCLNAATGRTLWQSEGRQGENAAIVAGKGLLYLLTPDGELTVARASTKGFEPVRTYSVADTPTWAHPVPLGARILIKDENSLTAWTVG